MTVPAHRHFLLSADFYVTAAILLIGTVLFRIYNLDMTLQRLFFSTEQGWYLGAEPVFKFVYHYGNIPALLISLTAIVVTVLSFRKTNYVKYRKIGLYLILTMIIGPGLLVNTVLKDNWGRPRPRNVDEFGGKYRFEEVLTMDRESDGKSFPCGHATMGYYLFTLWFLLRKNRRRLGTLFLVLGIGYGSFIGLARMTQGGHFASDVLWAGGLIYLTSYALYRALKLNLNLYNVSQQKIDLSTKRSKYHFLFWVIGVLLFFAILLATPYERTQSMNVLMEETEMLDITLAQGDVLVQADSLNVLTMQSSGFAFPSSRIKLVKRTNDSKTATMLLQDKKGVFSELIVHTNVSLDGASPLNLTLRAQKGDVIADLSMFEAIGTVNLYMNGDNGILKLPQSFIQKLYIENRDRVQSSRTDIAFTGDPDQAAIRIFNSQTGLSIE
jgi:membrane-associated PAP2 superfamily phosphatase